jgi:hypothetical protein
VLGVRSYRPGASPTSWIERFDSATPNPCDGSSSEERSPDAGEVEGSIPSRRTVGPIRQRETPGPASLERQFESAWVQCRSSTKVVRVLGKDEGGGSSPLSGSRRCGMLKYAHTGGPLFTLSEETRYGPASAATVSLPEDEG